MIDDRAGRRYTRPDRIRPLNHKVRYYQPAGPLDVPRCHRADRDQRRQGRWYRPPLSHLACGSCIHRCFDLASPDSPWAPRRR